PSYQAPNAGIPAPGGRNSSLHSRIRHAGLHSQRRGAREIPQMNLISPDISAPGMGLRSVAVFCGAHSGNDPAFGAAARALGAGLARARMRLVYGGGRIGLMGEVADAVLAAG